MEGLEAYDDVEEDAGIKMNGVIENNILDNEDIDIDYDVFIDEDVVDGNVQELGDFSSRRVILIYTFHNLFFRTFHIFTE